MASLQLGSTILVLVSFRMDLVLETAIQFWWIFVFESLKSWLFSCLSDFSFSCRASAALVVVSWIYSDWPSHAFVRFVIIVRSKWWDRSSNCWKTYSVPECFGMYTTLKILPFDLSTSPVRLMGAHTPPRHLTRWAAHNSLSWIYFC